VDEESLAFLGEIGQRTSLRSGFYLDCLLPNFFAFQFYLYVLLIRHAVQLLSPASVVAKINGRDNICKVIMD
jgi:RuvB-like protein 1 (pontin 52)